jgi:hypothetical protein
LYGFNSTYEKSTQIFGLKSETFAGIQLRYDDINDLELSRTKDRSITTEQLKFGDVDEMNLGAFWSQKISLNQNFDITPSSDLIILIINTMINFSSKIEIKF